MMGLPTVSSNSARLMLQVLEATTLISLKTRIQEDDIEEEATDLPSYHRKSREKSQQAFDRTKAMVNTTITWCNYPNQVLDWNVLAQEVLWHAS